MRGQSISPLEWSLWSSSPTLYEQIENDRYAGDGRRRTQDVRLTSQRHAVVVAVADRRQTCLADLDPFRRGMAMRINRLAPPR